MILLSPAKTLDFETKAGFEKSSDLLFAEKANYLAKKLKKMSPAMLKSMMDISENLAQLNYKRYQSWNYPFGKDGKQAGFAFKGDVYQGLEFETFSEKEIARAQDRLLILSGLYGLLRPLDLMLPYRLEMGTKWMITTKNKSLYSFWKNDITAEIKKMLAENEHNFILNLASQEYSKAVDFKKLKVPVLAPEFKEERGGEFKMISFFAKKARGLMAAFAIKNDILKMNDLKLFDSEGYTYNQRLSDDKNLKWVFTRKTK